MADRPSLSTSEMQVTSIRFERELIDRLKAMAGEQGYQALVRQVLWNYVQQPNVEHIARSQIRAVVRAIAQYDEVCALTGDPIAAGSEMDLGVMQDGQLVPLCRDAIASEY